MEARGIHPAARTALGLPLALMLCLGACRDPKPSGPDTPEARTATPEAGTAPGRYLEAGKLEAFEEAFYKVVPHGSRLEILAEGHEWTEGPLWVEAGGYLLYSDIPRNAIYRWDPDTGSSRYLEPSGFTGKDFQGAEPGSNGLLLDAAGKLVLCQHGDRRIARMVAPLDRPAPKFESLAERYSGARLNSPNDAVFDSEGVLYFTDPPYGLPGRVDDPEKELGFQGVYRLRPGGIPELLTDALSRPNGIGLSPDGSRLYVSNSDPENAIWMVYELGANGRLENGRVLHDATDQNPEATGNPDGLVVHPSGHIFATGPGGVFVFGPEGKVLGRILTGEKTSNCTLDTDQSALYITADSYVLKLDLKTE